MQGCGVFRIQSFPSQAKTCHPKQWVYMIFDDFWCLQLGSFVRITPWNGWCLLPPSSQAAISDIGKSENQPCEYLHFFFGQNLRAFYYQIIFGILKVAFPQGCAIHLRLLLGFGVSDCWRCLGLHWRSLSWWVYFSQKMMDESMSRWVITWTALDKT